MRMSYSSSLQGTNCSCLQIITLDTILKTKHDPTVKKNKPTTIYMPVRCAIHP